jgi:hypothetical protein
MGFGALLAASIALVGCGGSTGSADAGPPPVTGNWRGQSTTSITELVISLNDVSGNVTGAGELTSNQNTYSVTASGVYIPPTLTLTLASGLHPSTTLSATVSTGKIDVTLDGSGFSGESFTMTPQ